MSACHQHKKLQAFHFPFFLVWQLQMLAVLYTWGTSGDIQLPSEHWWSHSRHLRQVLSSPGEGTELYFYFMLITKHWWEFNYWVNMGFKTKTESSHAHPAAPWAWELTGTVDPSFSIFWHTSFSVPKTQRVIFSHPERWVPFLPTERLWETPVWAWKDIYGPPNPSISRPSKANCILLTAVLCSKSRTPRGKRRQSATGWIVSSSGENGKTAPLCPWRVLQMRCTNHRIISQKGNCNTGKNFITNLRRESKFQPWRVPSMELM